MAQRKQRILMFGYLPPPYHGVSITYQTLMQSQFPKHFDVTFINLNVARDLSDIEKFRVGKVVAMLGCACREFWLLARKRFDWCCYPVAFNRNAFLRDAFVLWVARWFSVPIVLYAHGNGLPEFHSRSSRLFQRIIDVTVGSAQAAIVLGKPLRFNFEQHLPAERILEVPYGLLMPPCPPSSRERRDRIQVLYLGNLIPEKGVLVLLRAIPQIVAKCPDVRFVFTGAWWRESHRQEAERIIRDNAIQQYVEFVGVVTGKAKQRLLSECDILAFPTFYHYETFGLVLLEALWAGLPVVTTRRAAIPEIIQEGVNGLFCEEQNTADLAEKILRLAGDPALRERMGQANRRRYENYYTHEHYGERMIRVFEALSEMRR